MECSAVLFDLDGVLIDLTSCVERHCTHTASTARRRSFCDCHGVRNVETMRLVAAPDVEQEAADFAANEVTDTRRDGCGGPRALCLMEPAGPS
jgi:beta-phosphoglucomutase-like phosphatase (HAD superfamily)